MTACLCIIALEHQELSRPKDIRAECQPQCSDVTHRDQRHNNALWLLCLPDTHDIIAWVDTGRAPCEGEEVRTTFQPLTPSRPGARYFILVKPKLRPKGYIIK